MEKGREGARSPIWVENRVWNLCVCWRAVDRKCICWVFKIISPAAPLPLLSLRYRRFTAPPLSRFHLVIEIIAITPLFTRPVRES